MVNTSMIWHHPKYYAALRAERKKLQAQAQAQGEGAQAEAASPADDAVDAEFEEVKEAEVVEENEDKK